MHIKSETSPVVSVIMPAYNAGKFIEDAIVSVLNQTYQSWELLVIDDGSSDDTIKIINTLSNKEPRIQLLKNKVNKGVAYSRNKGIKNSKGDWIAFLDSDDMWSHLKLEKQLSFAIKGKYDFLFTGAFFINEKGEIHTEDFKVPKFVNYKSLKRHNVISCSSVLIKGTYFKEMKMERDDIHEDFIIWLKILREYEINAVGLNEPLLMYRVTSDSKSGNKVKSVFMTYKVYRYLNINPLASLFYTISHSIGAFKKYRSLMFK